MSEKIVELPVTLTTCTCVACGIVFAMPSDFKSELRQNHKTFYCPSGHSQWFSYETEAETLQKELRRKEQELADKVIENLNLQKEYLRLKKGTCPCCKRTFQNLKSHIRNQHPELLNK